MSLRIGKAYFHPTDGPIYIHSGQLISNGRISNHWTWSKIDSDGKLDPVKLSGYGSNEWPELDADIEIKVTLKYAIK